MKRVAIVLGVIILFFGSEASFAQAPQILDLTPNQNQLNVLVTTDISVIFDIDMDEATINESTFLVNGLCTGLHNGSITYDAPSKMATFDSGGDFVEGEIVTIVLTTGIKSIGGIPLVDYVWSFTTVSAVASGAFAPHTTYYAGDYPRWVIAAELDEDGDLDLATANGGYPDDVSVLRNNGNGTFFSHTEYDVSSDPYSISSADLDGDGDLDLATANSNANHVSVLLNDGDGTFAPHTIYSVGDEPYSIFSADLDGDGDLDLATANYSSNDISILLNDGDGIFATHTTYEAGGHPRSAIAADFDDDGDFDLAWANSYVDNVAVLFNNGDGTFDPLAATYNVGDHPVSVFSADLDGDGDLDLAAANSHSLGNSVSVLLNSGDGTFAPHVTYDVGTSPQAVFSADLDGDGDLDLATANYSSNDISILLNDGDGTFATQMTYDVGDEPYSIFSADLDGDGDLDLATANSGSDNVSVLLNINTEDIPTLSEWGMIIFALLILSAGTIAVIRKRRNVIANG